MRAHAETSHHPLQQPPPAAAAQPNVQHGHNRPGHAEEGGGGSGGPPPAELELGTIGRFTEQDEAREMATLTIQDLLRLQSDLTGVGVITDGMSGLLGGGLAGASAATGRTDVAAGSSAPVPNAVPNVYQMPSAGPCFPTHGEHGSAPLSSLSDSQDRMRLAALEQHISTLPPSTTEVYHLAKLRCPDEVSPSKKLQFLECEDNDVGKAAVRMAKYWDLRRDLFGDDKCFLPMTLVGSMNDEVMNMAQMKVFQLMPHTDVAGRGIIFECWGNRDLARYAPRQEFRALTYLLHILMQDDTVRRRGYVMLVNGANTSGRQFAREFPKYLQWVDAALPIRMRAAHICNASPVMHYLILPTVKRFVPRDMRLRGKLHRGSAEGLLRYLAEYNLPSDRVPAELGGSAAVLGANQFLIDRMVLEAASAGLPLFSPTANAGEGTVAMAAAAVVPPPLANATSIGSSSIATEGDGTVTESSKRQRTAARKKTKKPRNVTDPRMARAVKAKQDDPEMPLNDALIVGGFRFEMIPGKKDIEIKDDEGIFLKQRKNNLLRRLRLAKEKKEEREKSSASEGIDGAVASSSAQEDRKPAAVSSFNSGSNSEETKPTSRARRDSFDDEILNLPGLDLF